MIGDRLAKGAKSASFGSLAHIPQAKWDSIWAEESELVKSAEEASGKDEKLTSEK